MRKGVNPMNEKQQQFYLDIKYQQNNSWQGSVQRLDTGEIINFRSALELMVLIEEAVQQPGESENSKERFRNWQQKKEFPEKASHFYERTGAFGQ